MAPLSSSDGDYLLFLSQGNPAQFSTHSRDFAAVPLYAPGTPQIKGTAGGGHSCETSDGTLNLLSLRTHLALFSLYTRLRTPSALRLHPQAQSSASLVLLLLVLMSQLRRFHLKLSGSGFTSAPVETTCSFYPKRSFRRVHEALRPRRSTHAERQRSSVSLAGLSLQEQWRNPKWRTHSEDEGPCMMIFSNLKLKSRGRRHPTLIHVVKGMRCLSWADRQSVNIVSACSRWYDSFRRPQVYHNSKGAWRAGRRS
ncbi:hypothetical protein OE88DRAFT_1283476 [Heliocybe sulcata]|uniref:Uncharacterized protein n=1 Tax=Heliocybe sulcata TaxID=5364 RepID=A0A5C3N970_9AGAM|nr:hypothetical protein OE88DRAFT_1283476 [Heliocybe sulcata]